MLSKDSVRSTSSLRLLCETAKILGIEEADCLRGTGLTSEDFHTENFKATLSQEIRAIENVVRLSPEKVGLGVSVGRQMHVNLFGIWGFAVLTSPTVRAAIKTAIDYVNLSFVIAEMTLSENGDVAKLKFEMSGLPTAIKPFIVERHCVVAMTFIKELIQQPDFDKFEIETTVNLATYGRKLSKLLNIRVVVDASSDALVFPTKLLDQPVLKSDPLTLKYCLDQCQELSDKYTHPASPWSQKVRNIVSENIHSEQKIDEVAASLSMTARTLRRRLTKEGTSFRELYADIRLTIARELLETGGFNVETTSWRVGYAEPASFVRAFSKKYNKTPGEVKRG